MLNDTSHQKVLAALDSWNIYNADQLLHNIKVSEYNYFKYIIYNMEEAEHRLWHTPFDVSYALFDYLFLLQPFFDKDLTHILLKKILKHDENIRTYVWYHKYNSSIINLLLINPKLNNYGALLLSSISSIWWFEYNDINNTLSYRDTIIKKYKDYTPTIIIEKIRTGAVVALSWSQYISWLVSEDNNLTWSDSKKDFAYCQQFKNKIPLYIKCIKSL
jgi:hypothetical protein